MEAGFSGVLPDVERAGLGLSVEFLYGVVLNTQIGMDLDVAAWCRAGSSERDLKVDEVSLNLLHNFNREYGRIPAFSIRGDVTLPTQENDRGVEVRVRGILSKALIQYDRLHLNLDGVMVSAPEHGERRFRPGVIFGYTQPLGYPKRFTQTGLAQLSIQTPARKGTGPVVSLGVGLRQQITVRSVVDVGVQSEVSSHGAAREEIRIVAGYSVGF